MKNFITVLLVSLSLMFMATSATAAEEDSTRIDYNHEMTLIIDNYYNEISGLTCSTEDSLKLEIANLNFDKNINQLLNDLESERALIDAEVEEEATKKSVLILTIIILMLICFTLILAAVSYAF